MTFENMNTDDFFPLLQQTLSDTFKIDSYLMHAPYQNFEKMDMGLRRMVWGNYKTNSPLFSLFGSSPYQIIVLQSSLGFYNVIVSLTTDAEPDILGIMPFLAEPINQVTINRLIRDNHIDPKYNSVLLHFYYSLPVVDIDELTLMLQHFISFFIPAFKTCSIEYVNYKTESHNTSPNEERFQKFSSDYIAELISRLEHCCQAMTAGNTAQAIDFMKKTLDYSASFQSLPAKEIRSRIASLNFFLASRMFGTAVHPIYVYQQAEAFSLRIKDANSQGEFAHLPFDMVRKYSMLAKNYTYEKYSYLIRTVVNYIDQHLYSELTLSILAEKFDKNPSYLSNAFKKEVGETLTSYIGRQRIRASLRYFNTTNMSVAEVAGAVGIPDSVIFRNFSRDTLASVHANTKKCWINNALLLLLTCKYKCSTRKSSLPSRR